MLVYIAAVQERRAKRLVGVSKRCPQEQRVGNTRRKKLARQKCAILKTMHEK
jgi:hypothetical protein